MDRRISLGLETTVLIWTQHCVQSPKDQQSPDLQILVIRVVIVLICFSKLQQHKNKMKEKPLDNNIQKINSTEKINSRSIYLFNRNKMYIFYVRTYFRKCISKCYSTNIIKVPWLTAWFSKYHKIPFRYMQTKLISIKWSFKIHFYLWAT